MQIKVLKAKEGIAFYIKEKDRTLLIMGASTLTEEMIALKPNWVIFPTWSIATQENKLAFESLPSTTCCIPCLYHTNPEALAISNELEKLKILLIIPTAITIQSKVTAVETIQEELQTVADAISFPRIVGSVTPEDKYGPIG